MAEPQPADSPAPGPFWQDQAGRERRAAIARNLITCGSTAAMLGAVVWKSLHDEAEDAIRRAYRDGQRRRDDADRARDESLGQARRMHDRFHDDR